MKLSRELKLSMTKSRGFSLVIATVSMQDTDPTGAIHTPKREQIDFCKAYGREICEMKLTGVTRIIFTFLDKFICRT